MTVTPTVAPMQASTSGVPYTRVDETRLNVLLSKEKPLLPAKLLRTIPALFRYQARILNRETAIITGKQVLDGYLRIRVEDPVLDYASDLPVITDEELRAAFAKDPDPSQTLEHLTVLKALITERMENFRGVSIKLRLVGIMNGNTGELQRMQRTNSGTLMAPMGWVTGHRSNTVQFRPQGIEGIIPESTLRSMHHLAALVYYIGKYYNEPNTFYQSSVYSGSHQFLTPESPSAELKFKLTVRQNPRSNDAAIGLLDPMISGFCGLGIFCGGGQRVEAARAESTPEELEAVQAIDPAACAFAEDAEEEPVPTVANPFVAAGFTNPTGETPKF
jgi:hypothetical protein